VLKHDIPARKDCRNRKLKVFSTILSGLSPSATTIHQFNIPKKRTPNKLNTRRERERERERE
jgi:hypothetical protein